MNYSNKIYTLDEITKVVTSIVKYRYPEIKKIAIFGSYSRGEPSPISDLDLLVLEPENIKPMTMWALGGEIKEKLKKPIEIFRLNSIDKKTNFYKKIVKEMIVLYEDKNNE